MSINITDKMSKPEGPYEALGYTKDLKSKPKPEYGKILVTGATGYIGGRLVPELVARGYKVRVMVRSELSDYQVRWPSSEVVFADARDYDQLVKALEGIHTAYYLIHSLLLGDLRKK